MAEPTDLVLEHLRAIRSKLDELDRKIDRVQLVTTERIDGLEIKVDSLTHAVIAGFGSLVHELDSLKERVSRLEAERV